jgi:hypothetical protein
MLKTITLFNVVLILLASTNFAYAVGGSVTDSTLIAVTCTNTNTGQAVKIKKVSGNTQWDCQNAGLNVSAGDTIKESISVKAIPSITTGCANNAARSGLNDQTKYPDIAACSGTWSGDISNGNSLCASGWQVCNGNDALNDLSYSSAIAVAGCFATNTANDNYICHSDCLAAVSSGVDTALNIDMGGVGSGCPWVFNDTSKTSCFKNGRIDSSENSGGGCKYNKSVHSGVMCCKINK